MRLPEDDRGASLVEYALLAVLIAVAAMAAVALFGSQQSALWDQINTGFQ